MRLKSLKRETKVRIKNKNEYLFLMGLLEASGYKWSTNNAPTEFNNNSLFWNTKCIVLCPRGKIIMVSLLDPDGSPIRKVIKYEVGDKVRIREDIAECDDEGIGIIGEMKELAGSISKIEYIDSDGDYNLECGFAWKKKWLTPVFESVEESVGWSKER